MPKEKKDSQFPEVLKRLGIASQSSLDAIQEAASNKKLKAEELLESIPPPIIYLASTLQTDNPESESLKSDLTQRFGEDLVGQLVKVCREDFSDLIEHPAINDAVKLVEERLQRHQALIDFNVQSVQALPLIGGFEPQSPPLIKLRISGNEGKSLMEGSTFWTDALFLCAGVANGLAASAEHLNQSSNAGLVSRPARDAVQHWVNVARTSLDIIEKSLGDVKHSEPPDEKK